nr:immunoglobulin light chain junction region [Macaca mulatta]MOX28411.1 immunoglobulin light chain junction region [Macaca mulatta]MOX29187.1 immunoglobulin light chain junction region [Macaca mulatta]MOX29461.1 immunoglobulin light chain junction region [Macaca mulatta]MOX29597.1 immunoglobulin light chain junction region [Macaca mulatta]
DYYCCSYTTSGTLLF